MLSAKIERPQAFWRFYESPFGDWRWISVCGAVEQNSQLGYPSLTDCVRDALRNGMDEDDPMDFARLFLVPVKNEASDGKRR